MTRGSDIERDIAPLNTEVLHFTLVACQPRQPVAQTVDGLAADEVGKWLADDRRRPEIAKHANVGADRFDGPIRANEQYQCTGLDGRHQAPKTRSKIMSTRFR